MAFSKWRNDPLWEPLYSLEIEAGKRLDEESWTVSSERLLVADTNNDRVKLHETDWTYLNEITEYYPGTDFVFPPGMCSDGVHIYILEGASANDYGITKYKCSDLSYVTRISGNGSGDDEFNAPRGICTDGTHLYIADEGNHRIKKHLCSDLSYVAKLGGSSGSGDDEFHSPTGVGQDGTYLYVADRQNHRIKKHLLSDLSYVAKLGSNGSGDDQFNYPYDIDTDGTHVYVADYGNHRIKKHLCSDLSYVAKLGSQGSGDDQFDDPSGIGIDTGRTYIYVADTGNNRIKKHLCSDLSYSDKFGSSGSGDDNFSGPRGADLYIPFPNLHYTAFTEGDPSKVLECNISTGVVTDYTEQASISDCNSNSGSYYYDEDNQRLYVHTNGSDDPSGGSYYIMALFWEYYTNVQDEDNPFHPNDKYAHPYLDESSIPNIDIGTTSFHEGGIEQSFGSISLINDDGYFDERLGDYIYTARKFIFRLGGVGGTYPGDFATLYWGYLGKWDWTVNGVTFAVEDFRRITPLA